MGGSSGTGANGAVSSSTPTPLTYLLIEEVDQYGNTHVLLVGETAVTSIIRPGKPLPSADVTQDPHSILQANNGPTSSKGATYAQYQGTANSNSTDRTSSTSSPVGGLTTTTTNADSQAQSTSSPPPDSKIGDDGGGTMLGVLVAIPIIVVALLVVVFILWWRKRRTAKRASMASQSQQMDVRSPEERLSSGPPGYSESTSGPLLMAGALSTSTTNNTTLTRTNTESVAPEQPVILNTNMQSAYFTGLDTSDALSMTSDAHANRPSFDNTLLNSDEPPPPYRPRSVPSISRETSLRHPHSSISTNTSGLATLSEADIGQPLGRGDGDGEATPTAETASIRNPFEDPENESDAGDITPILSPLMRGHNDNRSEVSDLSFERDPQR